MLSVCAAFALFFLLLSVCCPAIAKAGSIAATSDTFEPELEGFWKAASDDGVFIQFMHDRIIFRNNKVIFGARALYVARIVHYKQWAQWELLKYSLAGGHLTVPIGGKTVTLEKLSQRPAELDLSPMTLGARMPLDRQRIAEILAELNSRREKDQFVRTQKTPPEAMIKIDSENCAWLKALIAKIGWIDMARFGIPGANNAFLLVQHSMDLPMMQAVLPEIEADAQALLKQSNGALGGAYALLYDRTMLKLGFAQRYGSQLGMDGDGCWVIPSLEDPRKVNQRRAKIGMTQSLFKYSLFMRQENKNRDIQLQDDLNIAAGDKPLRPPLIPIPRNDEEPFFEQR